MIKIDFKEPDTHEWKKWREECERETTKILKAVEEGRKHKISSLYKKREIKHTYYISINGPFFGKCAYCETGIVSDQYGDMEHFRPANAVTDMMNNPVYVRDKEGNQVRHPGYYWLAHDWKNLLPACIKCNRPNPGEDKKGKGTRFPVEDGFYASKPGEEVNEIPLLINPLFEDPERHFKVELWTGVLGGDKKAYSCIQVFGLNDRPGILDARKAAYDTVLGLLTRYNNSHDEQEEKECIKALCDIVIGRKPFSFVGRTFLRKKYPSFYKDLSMICSNIPERSGVSVE